MDKISQFGHVTLRLTASNFFLIQNFSKKSTFNAAQTNYVANLQLPSRCIGAVTFSKNARILITCGRICEPGTYYARTMDGHVSVS